MRYGTKWDFSTLKRPLVAEIGTSWFQLYDAVYKYMKTFCLPLIWGKSDHPFMGYGRKCDFSTLKPPWWQNLELLGSNCMMQFLST